MTLLISAIKIHDVIFPDFSWFDAQLWQAHFQISLNADLLSVNFAVITI